MSVDVPACFPTSQNLHKKEGNIHQYTIFAKDVGVLEIKPSTDGQTPTQVVIEKLIYKGEDQMKNLFEDMKIVDSEKLTSVKKMKMLKQQMEVKDKTYEQQMKSKQDEIDEINLKFKKSQTELKNLRKEFETKLKDRDEESEEDLDEISPVDHELLNEVNEANASLDKIKEIVDKGADVNTKNKDGDTPLNLAARNGRIDIIQYLSTKGSDVNEPNENGYAPLIWAALNGQTETIEYLESKGAEINQKNNYGSNPLMLAAWNGSLETVKYLLSKKRSAINETNKFGESALFYAVRFGHLQVVQYLVEQGADLSIKDKWGKTPLDIAKVQKCYEVVKFLPTFPTYCITAVGYYWDRIITVIGCSENKLKKLNQRC